MTSSIVLTGLQKSSGSASKASAHSSAGPRGEDLVEQSDELAGVNRPGGQAVEALVGDPLGMADRSGQGGPVAVTLEADDPEGTAVPCRVIVHDGAVHRFSHSDIQRPAPHEHDVEVEADGVAALAQQGGRDDLTVAGAGLLDEGGADHGGTGHGCRVVAHAASLERQGATGRTQRLGDAGSRPKGRDVVGAPFCVRPLQAIPGDDGVDQAGVTLVYLVGAEPDALEGGRAQVRQEDVGPCHQLIREVQATFVRKVECNGALAPVVQLEHRIGRQVTTEHVEEGPTRVPLGRLDLHDIRTPVGQDAAGTGAGDPDAEFDHPHAVQRPAHEAEREGQRAAKDSGALTKL